MANCHKCEQPFSFFTIRNERHPNPLGDGFLCRSCYLPYLLVLEKYASHLKEVDANPKAAAWVALCCLLTARRVNLVRSVTAVLCGFFEQQNSWEVCRQRVMELTTNAISLMPSDCEGRRFMRGLFECAEAISRPPSRLISSRLHASVMGDTIPDIAHQALACSGVSMDELYDFIVSLPGHGWLLPAEPGSAEPGKSPSPGHLG